MPGHRFLPIDECLLKGNCNASNINNERQQLETCGWLSGNCNVTNEKTNEYKNIKKIDNVTSAASVFDNIESYSILDPIDNVVLYKNKRIVDKTLNHKKKPVSITTTTKITDKMDMISSRPSKLFTKLYLQTKSEQPKFSNTAFITLKATNVSNLLYTSSVMATESQSKFYFDKKKIYHTFYSDLEVSETNRHTFSPNNVLMPPTLQGINKTTVTTLVKQLSSEDSHSIVEANPSLKHTEGVTLQSIKFVSDDENKTQLSKAFIENVSKMVTQNKRSILKAPKISDLTWLRTTMTIKTRSKRRKIYIKAITNEFPSKTVTIRPKTIQGNILDKIKKLKRLNDSKATRLKIKSTKHKLVFITQKKRNILKSPKNPDFTWLSTTMTIHFTKSKPKKRNMKGFKTFTNKYPPKSVTIISKTLQHNILDNNKKMIKNKGRDKSNIKNKNSIKTHTKDGNKTKNVNWLRFNKFRLSENKLYNEETTHEPSPTKVLPKQKSNIKTKKRGKNKKTTKAEIKSKKLKPKMYSTVMKKINKTKLNKKKSKSLKSQYKINQERSNTKPIHITNERHKLQKKKPKSKLKLRNGINHKKKIRKKHKKAKKHKEITETQFSKYEHFTVFSKLPFFWGETTSQTTYSTKKNKLVKDELVGKLRKRKAEKKNLQITKKVNLKRVGDKATKKSKHVKKKTKNKSKKDKNKGKKKNNKNKPMVKKKKSKDVKIKKKKKSKDVKKKKSKDIKKKKQSKNVKKEKSKRDQNRKKDKDKKKKKKSKKDKKYKGIKKKKKNKNKTKVKKKKKKKSKGDKNKKKHKGKNKKKKKSKNDGNQKKHKGKNKKKNKSENKKIKKKKTIKVKKKSNSKIKDMKEFKGKQRNASNIQKNKIKIDDNMKIVTVKTEVTKTEKKFKETYNTTTVNLEALQFNSTELNISTANMNDNTQLFFNLTKSYSENNASEDFIKSDTEALTIMFNETHLLNTITLHYQNLNESNTITTDTENQTNDHNETLAMSEFDRKSTLLNLTETQWNILSNENIISFDKRGIGTDKVSNKNVNIQPNTDDIIELNKTYISSGINIINSSVAKTTWLTNELQTHKDNLLQTLQIDKINYSMTTNVAHNFTKYFNNTVTDSDTTKENLFKNFTSAATNTEQMKQLNKIANPSTNQSHELNNASQTINNNNINKNLQTVSNQAYTSLHTDDLSYTTNGSIENISTMTYNTNSHEMYQGPNKTTSDMAKQSNEFIDTKHSITYNMSVNSTVHLNESKNNKNVNNQPIATHEYDEIKELNGTKTLSTKQSDELNSTNHSMKLNISKHFTISSNLTNQNIQLHETTISINEQSGEFNDTSQSKKNITLNSSKSDLSIEFKETTVWSTNHKDNFSENTEDITTKNHEIDSNGIDQFDEKNRTISMSTVKPGEYNSAIDNIKNNMSGNITTALNESYFNAESKKTNLPTTDTSKMYQLGETNGTTNSSKPDLSIELKELTISSNKHKGNLSESRENISTNNHVIDSIEIDQFDGNNRTTSMSTVKSGEFNSATDKIKNNMSDNITTALNESYFNAESKETRSWTIKHVSGLNESTEKISTDYPTTDTFKIRPLNETNETTSSLLKQSDKSTSSSHNMTDNMSQIFAIQSNTTNQNMQSYGTTTDQSGESVTKQSDEYNGTSQSIKNVKTNSGKSDLSIERKETTISSSKHTTSMSTVKSGEFNSAIDKNKNNMSDNKTSASHESYFNTESQDTTSWTTKHVSDFIESTENILSNLPNTDTSKMYQPDDTNRTTNSSKPDLSIEMEESTISSNKHEGNLSESTENISTNNHVMGSIEIDQFDGNNRTTSTSTLKSGEFNSAIDKIKYNMSDNITIALNVSYFNAESKETTSWTTKHVSDFSKDTENILTNLPNADTSKIYQLNKTNGTTNASKPDLSIELKETTIFSSKHEDNLSGSTENISTNNHVKDSIEIDQLDGNNRTTSMSTVNSGEFNSAIDKIKNNVGDNITTASNESYLDAESIETTSWITKHVDDLNESTEKISTGYPTTDKFKIHPFNETNGTTSLLPKQSDKSTSSSHNMTDNMSQNFAIQSNTTNQNMQSYGTTTDQSGESLTEQSEESNGTIHSIENVTTNSGISDLSIEWNETTISSAKHVDNYNENTKNISTSNHIIDSAEIDQFNENNRTTSMPTVKSGEFNTAIDNIKNNMSDNKTALNELYFNTESQETTSWTKKHISEFIEITENILTNLPATDTSKMYQLNETNGKNNSSKLDLTIDLEETTISATKHEGNLGENNENISTNNHLTDLDEIDQFDGNNRTTSMPTVKSGEFNSAIDNIKHNISNNITTASNKSYFNVESKETTSWTTKHVGDLSESTEKISMDYPTTDTYKIYQLNETNGTSILLTKQLHELNITNMNNIISQNFTIKLNITDQNMQSHGTTIEESLTEQEVESLTKQSVEFHDSSQSMNRTFNPNKADISMKFTEATSSTNYVDDISDKINSTENLFTNILESDKTDQITWSSIMQLDKPDSKHLTSKTIYAGKSNETDKIGDSSVGTNKMNRSSSVATVPQVKIDDAKDYKNVYMYTINVFINLANNSQNPSHKHTSKVTKKITETNILSNKSHSDTDIVTHISNNGTATSNFEVSYEYTTVALSNENIKTDALNEKDQIQNSSDPDEVVVDKYQNQQLNGTDSSSNELHKAKKDACQVAHSVNATLIEISNVSSVLNCTKSEESTLEDDDEDEITSKEISTTIDAPLSSIENKTSSEETDSIANHSEDFSFTSKHCFSYCSGFCSRFTKLYLLQSKEKLKQIMCCSDFCSDFCTIVDNNICRASFTQSEIKCSPKTTTKHESSTTTTFILTEESVTFLNNTLTQTMFSNATNTSFPKSLHEQSQTKTYIIESCNKYPKNCYIPRTWETTIKGETRDLYQIIRGMQRAKRNIHENVAKTSRTKNFTSNIDIPIAELIPTKSKSDCCHNNFCDNLCNTFCIDTQRVLCAKFVQPDILSNETFAVTLIDLETSTTNCKSFCSGFCNCFCDLKEDLRSNTKTSLLLSKSLTYSVPVARENNTTLSMDKVTIIPSILTKTSSQYLKRRYIALRKYNTISKVIHKNIVTETAIDKPYSVDVLSLLDPGFIDTSVKTVSNENIPTTWVTTVLEKPENFMEILHSKYGKQAVVLKATTHWPKLAIYGQNKKFSNLPDRYKHRTKFVRFSTLLPSSNHSFWKVNITKQIGLDEKPVLWETTLIGERRNFLDILRDRFGPNAIILPDTTHWPKQVLYKPLKWNNKLRETKNFLQHRVNSESQNEEKDTQYWPKMYHDRNIPEQSLVNHNRPSSWETTPRGQTKDFRDIFKARFGPKAFHIEETTFWPKLTGSIKPNILTTMSNNKKGMMKKILFKDMKNFNEVLREHVKNKYVNLVTDIKSSRIPNNLVFPKILKKLKHTKSGFAKAT